MKKRMGLLMAAVVSCLLITNAVYAQGAKEYENKGAPAEIKQGEKIFDQLNLTPEQKQKLQANRQTQRQQMQGIMTSLREKYKSLQEALKNPAVTRTSVQEIVDEIKALQAKQTDLRLDGIFSVKEILTPEQYVKFQQLMEEKAGKMRKAGKKHERRGERP